MKIDLQFEIADEKNVVKFWGRLFCPFRQALVISDRISEQISGNFRELRFKFRVFFSQKIRSAEGRC